MADWSDVERLARELPAVEGGTSYGNRAWKVGGKGFAWERPLRRTDLEALGDAAPGLARAAEHEDGGVGVVRHGDE